MVRNGSASGLQRYKCRDCDRTFNALTGTPLARLRQKSKWLTQAEVLRDGVTITQAAKRLKVARSTAFRWRHRFMTAPKTLQAQSLVGIAEADETFFLHSRKGQRDLDRKPRRRGGGAAKRGLSREQVAGWLQGRALGVARGGPVPPLFRGRVAPLQTDEADPQRSSSSLPPRSLFGLASPGSRVSAPPFAGVPCAPASARLLDSPLPPPPLILVVVALPVGAWRPPLGRWAHGPPPPPNHPLTRRRVRLFVCFGLGAVVGCAIWDSRRASFSVPACPPPATKQAYLPQLPRNCIDNSYTLALFWYIYHSVRLKPPSS